MDYCLRTPVHLLILPQSLIQTSLLSFSSENISKCLLLEVY